MNHYIRRLYKLILPMIITSIAFPAMADQVDIAMQEVSSGGMYIQTTLNDSVETEMLLDTGSSYVAIGISTFNRIAASAELTHSRDIYGAMANGEVEKVSLFILEKLQLSANCILRNIEVVLLPNADKDILGLNALSLLQPFTLKMAPASLSTQNCST